MKAFQFTEDQAENCMSTSFSHIFQGGYSAGYYSYKWAEVLDADAFELFLSNGIFDAKTAQSFHDNILSKEEQNTPWSFTSVFAERNPRLMLCLNVQGYWFSFAACQAL